MGSALRCFVVVEQVLTRAAASKKKKADDDREEEQQQPGSDEQRRRRRKSSSARRAPARTPTTRASWGERDKKPLFVPDLSGSRKGRVKFFTRERLLSRGFRREPELFFLFFFFFLTSFISTLFSSPVPRLFSSSKRHGFAHRPRPRSRCRHAPCAVGEARAARAAAHLLGPRCRIERRREFFFSSPFSFCPRAATTMPKLFLASPSRPAPVLPFLSLYSDRERSRCDIDMEGSPRRALETLPANRLGVLVMMALLLFFFRLRSPPPRFLRLAAARGDRGLAFFVKLLPFALFLRVYCMGDAAGEAEAVERKEAQRITERSAREEAARESAHLFFFFLA